MVKALRDDQAPLVLIGISHMDENSQISRSHTNEVNNPLFGVALVLADLVSSILDCLVKGTHAFELLFVVKLSVELAFAGLDATELEPRIEGSGMACVELAAGLEALDSYLKAIVNRSIWMIAIQILFVLGWSDRSVGEVLFKAGGFFLIAISIGKEFLMPDTYPWFHRSDKGWCYIQRAVVAEVPGTIIATVVGIIQVFLEAMACRIEFAFDMSVINDIDSLGCL